MPRQLGRGDMHSLVDRQEVGLGVFVVWEVGLRQTSVRSIERDIHGHTKPWCATAGRARYSQAFLLAWRGATKAEAVTCSAYRPKRTFRGLF